jgi:NADPH2:quinone reductase
MSAIGAPAIGSSTSFWTTASQGKPHAQPATLWRGNHSMRGMYSPSSLDREHERVQAQVQEILATAARGETVIFS